MQDKPNRTKNKDKSRPKTLREDLQKRKDALEAKGWKIDVKNKSAYKNFDQSDSTRFSIGNAVSIEQLFDQAEAYELSDKSDGDGKTDFAASPVVQLIPVDLIFVSPFEAQERRRKIKFETDAGKLKTEELGDSIIETGLLQPIMVRPLGGGYEIVYGERRWLAHKIKGLPTLPAFVRDLTDAETLKAQHFENHGREEPDALEDALRWKYLIEHENYTEERIASEYATTKSTVKKKIRLNNLISEALAELAGGILPLKHAYYLATFPHDSQKQIVKGQYAYKWQDKTMGAAPFEDFKDEVEQNIVRDLSTAPFDTEDTRLHIKELICSKCPEQTGFNRSLYEDDFKKGDKCLNESCFSMKTNVFMKLQQQELAEEKIATKTPDEVSEELPEEFFDKILKSVPLVTANPTFNKKELPIKGNVLTNQIIFDEPECEFSERSLVVDGANKNKKAWRCQSDECPVHHPETIAPEDQKSGPTDAELQQMEKRFQTDVETTTRRKVLEKSIEFFTGSNSFWQYADLVEKLIVELFLSRPFYLNLLSGIFKRWEKFPKNLQDRKSVEDFVAHLAPHLKDRLLFLLVFCRTESLSFEIIQDLTRVYTKESYVVLEAETRLELAPEDFKDLANLNLQYVKNGRLDEVKNFWWNDPKEAD